jgi:hypothetical protein
MAGFMSNFTRNIFSPDKTSLPLASAPFYNYPVFLTLVCTNKLSDCEWKITVSPLQLKILISQK